MSRLGTVPPRSRQGRITLTPTSWSAPPDLSFIDWVEDGSRLARLGRPAWWIGDWLRFGSEAFGERYAPAARTTGYDPQSLMNMVYVASKIAPERRREQLSWSHHAELAALEPTDQDRWLEHAVRARLSVRSLREAIRSERRAAAAA